MQYVKQGDAILSFKNFIIRRFLCSYGSIFERAKDCYVKALMEINLEFSFNEMIDVHYKIVKCYEKMKDYENIVKWLTKIADNYFGHQNYHEAIKVYSKTIKYYTIVGDNCGISRIYSKLSKCYERLGLFDDEIECLKLCLEFDPSYDKEMNDKINLTLAQKYSLRKEYKKAIEIFLEISSKHIAYPHLKCSVHKYLMFSIILSLMMNKDDRIIYDECIKIDDQFKDSMENNFIIGIMESLELNDTKLLFDSFKIYNRIGKSDRYLEILIYRIKDLMEERKRYLY